MNENTPQAQVVRHFTDIDFSVIAEPSESRVGFKVYSIFSDEPKMTWSKWGDDGNIDWAYVIEDADIYLQGAVKRDGCSNWDFVEQEKTMLHFCSKSQAMSIGILLGRLYDLAVELLRGGKASESLSLEVKTIPLLNEAGSPIGTAEANQDITE